MADYINLPCPVCGKAFGENDDIVVCPYCGTPHHRECYKQNGGCANEAWHSENRVYNADDEREKIEEEKRRNEWEIREKERAAAAQIVCRRCGQQNAPDALFCSRCGAPVSQGYTPAWQIHHESENKQQGQHQNDAPNQNIPKSPYGTIIINPFIVEQDPNEEIDGIPAWKLSAVIGQNAARVLAQFKLFAKTGRKISFNFIAMLISPFYFLYRKMYALGIIALIAEFLLTIPSLVISFSNENLSDMLGRSVDFGLNLNVAQTNFFLNLSSLASIASLAISALCGLFANWLYFEKCKRLCKKIDKTAHTEQEFKEIAAKKGGTSLKFIIALAIIVGTIYLFSYAAIMANNPDIFKLK